MSKKMIFETAHANLVKILKGLAAKSSGDDDKKLEMAIFFANEMGLLWHSDAPIPSPSEQEVVSDSDSTSYGVYGLLRELGLTPEKAILVAEKRGAS